MRYFTFIFICMVVASIQVSAQPDTLWTMTFGGTEQDDGSSVQQTTDGGFIITGGTSSFGAGYYDVLLLKLDSDGDEEWNQTFGGTDGESGLSVQQTTDGGYIIAGYTESFGAGDRDVWLVKADSTGEEEWSQTFGGTDAESGSSVQQTTDGGYIIAGYTESCGAGDIDVWLVKADSTGEEEWNQTFGGDARDRGYSVQQTNDGGYIITGSRTIDDDTDVWLIKTDSDGDEEWNQTFGSEYCDYGYDVKQTDDGGYIITGSFHVFEEDSLTERLIICLIKTDSDGDEDWNRIFRGLDEQQFFFMCDIGFCVQQTNDSGYIISGVKNLQAGMAIVGDLFLLKTDSTGEEEWNQNFERNFASIKCSVNQTNDGGYIVAGCTDSFGEGERDLWLIRIDTEDIEPPTPFALLSPDNEAVLDLEEPFEVTFGWASSIDTDPGYTVRYNLRLHAFMTDLDSTIYVTSLTDTQFTMTIEEAFGLEYWDESIDFDWHVEAISGEDTTNCDTSFTFQVTPHTAIAASQLSGIPSEYSIVSAYPNPFNPTTTISIGLPTSSALKLSVYNITGQKIAVLTNNRNPAGYHNFIFSADGLSSGIYFIHATVPGKMNELRKVVLVR
ncbi:MAG: T9SS type A sorting domain-containing protein [Candidatus Electryonea clarkiae]|nr:T9SS type A sorting domain-containing protein [Candidatus Electryonea clarkiae]MDP8287815.1 T9SS type A sorting domain-containing protein [Candidatus Electryonea clarkiae]